MLDGNKWTTRKEREEQKEKEKEHGHAVLVQTREKEESQFRIFRLREKIKYIVKIQGKKFTFFCLLARR